MRIFILSALPSVTVFVAVLSSALSSALAEDKDPDDDLTYEAKLLDRMKRMEARMEQLDKTVGSAKSIFKLTIEDQTKFFNNKTAEIEQLQEKIDKPLVAFNAYSPNDRSMDTDQIYVWTATRVNEGNAYDPSTGIFKAPVSGMYFFSVHTCTTTTANVYAIVKEKTDIATSYQYDNAVNDCTSMNTVTMVTAGQRVWVRCTSGSTSYQLWESSGRSSFIGALIHKKL